MELNEMWYRGLYQTLSGKFNFSSISPIKHNIIQSPNPSLFYQKQFIKEEICTRHKIQISLSSTTIV